MRRALALVAIGALALSAAAPGLALAAPPRTTLGDVEGEVMCPVCGTPLNVAESPQANRERAYIRGLIAQGKTKAQVKQALVAQFGPQVLALPESGEGVNWAVYVIPGVLLLAALAALAIYVPRWRRHGGDAEPSDAARPALGAEDEQRLEQELAKFD